MSNTQQESAQQLTCCSGTSDKYWVLKVAETNEILYADPDCELEIAAGQEVIVPTKFGLDLARVMGRSGDCPFNRISEEALKEDDRDMPSLVVPQQLANDEDLEEFEANKAKSGEAFGITQELIQKHNLNMKLVRVHFVLRENRIVFFFTSDKRVDFRALVRDLVNHFRARIELRQIGVRDESRMIGGRGVCGRKLCCSAVSHTLEPVSIKMAKVQKLSLNSQKISGPCGRLLCCLAFEHETYEKEQRGLPREGQWLVNEGQRLKIVEVNVLNRRVTASDREGIRQSFDAVQLKYAANQNAWSVIAPACMRASSDVPLQPPV